MKDHTVPPALTDLTVRPTHTVREVMACLDRTARGIVLILDSSGRLVRTITDGDLRRALLAGRTLDDPVFELEVVETERGTSPPCVTAPRGTPASEQRRLMIAHRVRHLPLLDDHDRVVDVATLSDGDEELRLEAVVMAGGFGRRLAPLTDSIPKPMLPVGDRPVMEHILRRLSAAGVRHVNVSTHYRADAIVEHFGDGRALGLRIEYVHEDSPLGTAGALSLIDRPVTPCLVVNGDVLTGVDVRAMLTFHTDNAAAMTVGVRQYEVNVPYGVVEIAGTEVVKLSEKPCLRFFVNAGVYILAPHLFERMEHGARVDATELIESLIIGGERVVSFPIHERWLDIGLHEDYARANREWDSVEPPAPRRNAAAG